MRSLPHSLLSIALLIASAGIAAEEALPPARSPILEATPPPGPAKAPAPAPPRLVSTDMAAKLAASLPVYAPPSRSKPTEQWPDAREIDKPRNGIVRLPQKIVAEYLMPRVVSPATSEVVGDLVMMAPYVVSDAKVPQFKERDLLTPYGKLVEAYKRQPGLRFLGNGGVALALLEADYERERKAEMKELYGLYQYSEPKPDAEPIRGSDKAPPRQKAP